MKFVTDDGKTFDTIEKAEQHEKEIAEKELKKKKYSEEKDKRLKEVEKAFNDFEKLYKEYLKDYGDNYNWSKWFDDVFDVIYR